MIAGLGLDLVEIARVAESLERHGSAFADRILGPDEDRSRVGTAEGATHLAGLFAAKEAVMKALGTGMAGAAFREIAILNRPGGEPYVRLSGRALETANRRAIRDWRISITHSRTVAAAVAIALA
ncbi:MAG: holo-ACP synthase [Planctomycetes bacterium]|nr:holo-ACP synthase [Planctomycetota bacterium]